ADRARAKARLAAMIVRCAHRKEHGRGQVMVRDSRGSIGDGEIGAEVRGPASSRLISLWLRSYAPWREHSRRLGSLPNLPRGYPEWVWSARGGDGCRP